MKKQFKHKKRAGQATVEYILLIVTAIVFVATLFQGLNLIRRYVWKQMACQIVAPCPGCPVSDLSRPGLDRFPGQCSP